MQCGTTLQGCCGDWLFKTSGYTVFKTVQVCFMTIMNKAHLTTTCAMDTCPKLFTFSKFQYNTEDEY